MKILVAGGTGIIGQRLIPLLVAANHEVTGTTRTADKSKLLEQLGATPCVVNVFDREQLTALVSKARPDVIIQQLTDLSARNSKANAYMRREGTRNLVDAAHKAGVRRFIAQSISWIYAPGNSPADETVPLDLEAPEPRRSTIKGVQALERAVAEIERWVVLRYGVLYGPGTWYAPDGFIAEQVRLRQLPADEGITSFLHVEDAARAALLALDWPQGIVNVVDDNPTPGTTWLPVYATSLGAPPPPITTGRPRAARGATNAKARQILHWHPLYPSWRKGFAQITQERRA
ncbi:NAD(P)-dependent oxidoreductase [Ktedonosporobacter rubrisoli]|uniref:NAD(P)-dependent oxidoreductase n=1 Tax=Ktedonosporobacter rubrisoli TaxID=2509675 RepID=A0A4P6K3S0_KTERU|nr:NAD(P)-dependent oxidoreductase [Ktedonosporobacter rubrisoli]QBD82917.1 NAD(P)-dependent oxidoreductase [Ktedonosporobacter rubrisoli]